MGTASIAWTLSALAILQVSSVDAQRITRRESHGEVRNRVSVSSVVAAIDNAPAVAARMADLPPLTLDQIRVVDVRPYVGSAVRRGYADAMQRRAHDIEALRTALVANDSAVKVLRAQQPPLTVDHVIAAGLLDVIETGKSSDALVLYIDRTNRIGIASDSSGSRGLMSYRPTAANLLLAIQTSPEMVARVSAMNSLRLDRVMFFAIDEIVKAADAEAYERAVRQNEFAIRSLRAELSKRPIVMHALERHDAKLMLGDIHAADVRGEDDALVLYFKRPATAATKRP